MLQEQAAFSSGTCKLLFNFSESVLRPFLWSFSQSLAPFAPLTNKRRTPIQRITRQILQTSASICLMVILSIPALIAFIIRCLLHKIKNTYVLSVKFNKCTVCDLNPSVKSAVLANSCGVMENGPVLHYFKEEKFGVASINTCLLPEYLSMFNNNHESPRRARQIGERIIVDQMFYGDQSSGVQNVQPPKNNIARMKRTSAHSGEFTHDVQEHFSKLDFICLQEMWHRDYCRIMLEELHKVFPWVVYDIGVSGVKINRYLFNSGLMFASRYPILKLDFKWFTASCNYCAGNSKGLLMSKVLVDKSEDGKSSVGYVFTTHLQAYQGDLPILDKQLDDVLKWTAEFREQCSDDDDIVKFDVVCGDFNFDNMSPCEAEYREHELFRVYEDICRVRPGLDHSWTVGTELRQTLFWEKAISSPEGLKQALQDPVLRQRYIVDANIESPTLENIAMSMPEVDDMGNIVPSPVGGKRRIDYILYRKENQVSVKSFNFVTRLATLTDHLPVSMTFTPL